MIKSTNILNVVGRIRVLSQLVQLCTVFRNNGFGLFHLDVNIQRHKTTKPGSTRRGGLSSIPFSSQFHLNPEAGSIAVTIQLTQDLEQIALICPVWQQAPGLKVSSICEGFILPNKNTRSTVTCLNPFQFS